MKQKILKSEGFTMVELLAVAVIFVSVTSIISAILFSSLRGVSRTNVTDAVRQSGNSAVSTFSRDVKFAKTFGGVSSGPDGNDEESYITNCSVFRSTIEPTPSPTPIPAPFKFLKITTLDNEEIIYSCEDALYKIQDGLRSPLFKSDAAILSPVDSCFFTCTQNVLTDPPTIGIHFILTQADEETTFFVSYLYRRRACL